MEKWNKKFPNQLFTIFSKLCFLEFIPTPLQLKGIRKKAKMYNTVHFPHFKHNNGLGRTQIIDNISIGAVEKNKAYNPCSVCNFALSVFQTPPRLPYLLTFPKHVWTYPCC